MMKEHHKSPVVSIKFCDWIKEKPVEEDKAAWMFISCDMEGKVIISKVFSMAFGILTVDKISVIDPSKMNK
jgi:hypothetical protein